MATENIRDLFITGLRNAHALESEALSILNAQVDRLVDYPELQGMVSEHITETDEQRIRLERILSGLNEDASNLKDAAASFMGKMAAITHTIADDEVLKNVFADLAFENFEIAAYTSLITMAQSGGFDIAMQPLEASLREEEAMASWLKANITAITQRFMQLSTGV